jgi:erythronate-4-phosphate dehydrogenase
MAVQALAHHFDLPLKEWRPNEVAAIEPREISWEEMCSTIANYCDLAAESDTLRQAPQQFENLRNNYLYREEYF